MQRAVNLTVYGVTMAMHADSDEEEQVMRSARKHLEDAITAYSEKFPSLPVREMLVRVAFDMAFNAVGAEFELKKINDECQSLRKDLLSF